MSTTKFILSLIIVFLISSALYYGALSLQRSMYAAISSAKATIDTNVGDCDDEPPTVRPGD